jgi:hypothetical protein
MGHSNLLESVSRSSSYDSAKTVNISTMRSTLWGPAGGVTCVEPTRMGRYRHTVTATAA